MTGWLKKQIEHVTTWLTFILLLGAAVAGYSDLVQRLARIETRNEISDARQKEMEAKLDKLLDLRHEKRKPSPYEEGYQLDEQGANLK